MLRISKKDTEHCFLTQFRHPDLAANAATPSVRDSHPFCKLNALGLVGTVAASPPVGNFTLPRNYFL